MAGPAANFRQAAQACLPGHPRLYSVTAKKGVDAQHKAGHDNVEAQPLATLCKISANASGAVTCGEWLASIS